MPQKKLSKLFSRCEDCTTLALKVYNDGTGRYICADCKYGERVGDVYFTYRVYPSSAKRPNIDDYDCLGDR